MPSRDLMPVRLLLPGCRASMDVPPYNITDPTPDQSRLMMFHTFPHLSHALRLNLLLLLCENHQWCSCHLYYSMANTSRAPVTPVGCWRPFQHLGGVLFSPRLSSPTCLSHVIFVPCMYDRKVKLALVRPAALTLYWSFWINKVQSINEQSFCFLSLCADAAWTLPTVQVHHRYCEKNEHEHLKCLNVTLYVRDRGHIQKHISHMCILNHY